MGNDKRKVQSSFARAPLIGIALLVVVVTGLVVDADKSEHDNFYADIIRLDNVATKIHQNYVEEVDSKELVNNSIEGMLEILDPHTSYFEKKQYEELRIHTEGKFGGLGIQISIRDKVLTVMTPIGGTPASRAGIQSGDQIIRIDGESTKGITIDEAVGKLRGEPGSEVTITIRRKGEGKDLDYTITREVIRIKAVPFYGILDSKIGYIRLLTYSQEAGDEVEKAIKELLAKDVKGLILDLRHNPGGLLPQAIEVSEKFLPRKSLVVSTRGRVRGQNKEFYARSSPVLPKDVPLSVLVDYASASASEIVSGAIQDWDRGVVVGDTTFGKGSVQSILPLDKTHHLKLTTAFYYTPSGRCINKPENDIRGGDEEDEEESAEAVSDTSSEANGEEEEAESARDTSTYRTKGGRIVHGGGGIIPDTVVIEEPPPSIIRALFGKDVFFKFANVEYPKLKKRKVTIDKNFEISKRTLKDFYAYLDSIDFEFKTYAQSTYEEFKQRAGLMPDSAVDSTEEVTGPEEYEWLQKEKEKLLAVSKEIESVLAGARDRLMKKYVDEIKKHLRSALLIRAFGQDHEVVYRTKLAEDPQLKTAVSILTDSEEYSSLLSPSQE